MTRLRKRTPIMKQDSVETLLALGAEKRDRWAVVRSVVQWCSGAVAVGCGCCGLGQRQLCLKQGTAVRGRGRGRQL
jgi:hypothetical protein